MAPTAANGGEDPSAMANGKPADAGEHEQRQHAARYGADNLTPRQFFFIQLALFLGSSIEWFDFSVYGALAAVITPLFFPPSGGPATQALYFWAIFALSFVTRPIGSLLLGSVGDRWGRRPALLISLVGMAVPTVLIGCLPTYQHVGAFAPAALAVLRLVQGIAMGCEFSSAMIYSVELAPRGKKGVFGALTFQAGVVGIALGNAAVMILTAALTPEQMSLWGWRLPFLLTAFSAFGAFVLRMHMPEPRAWEAACEKTGLPVSNDAAAVASPRSCCPPSRRQKRRRPARHTPGVPALKLLRHSWPQVLLQTLFEAFGSVGFYTFALWLPTSHRNAKIMTLEVASGVTIAALAFMAGTSMLGGWVSDVCATPRKRIGASSAAVAVGTAIVVPGFVAIAARAPPIGVPATALAPPDVQAGAAFFQIIILGLAGITLGLTPSLCAELYRPDVRVVSFSLAHNLAMSLLGGTAPLVISAMRTTSAGQMGAGPGIYVAAAGGASLLASAVLAVWSTRLFVAAPAATALVGAAAGAEDNDEDDDADEAGRIDEKISASAACV